MTVSCNQSLTLYHKVCLLTKSKIALGQWRAGKIFTKYQIGKVYYSLETSGVSQRISSSMNRSKVGNQKIFSNTCGNLIKKCKNYWRQNITIIWLYGTSWILEPLYIRTTSHYSLLGAYLLMCKALIPYFIIYTLLCDSSLFLAHSQFPQYLKRHDPLRKDRFILR